MASKKSLQDEKLINNLYEKLNWFTFQASEEEFDVEQVKAILNLLDTLDPMPETAISDSSTEENKCVSASDSDAAFERFKQKYHITDEELAEKNAGNMAMVNDEGKIYPFPAEFAEELVPDARRIRTTKTAADLDSRRKEDSLAGHEPKAVDTEAGEECCGKASSGDVTDGRRGRKRDERNEHKRFISGAFSKAAVGLLIVVGATAFLSIGTSAVQQKFFFEIVRDGVNSMKITVTGNDMETKSQAEPTLSLESEEKVYFDSWDEVKEENPDILVPGYIPEGLELKELYKQELGYYVRYKCVYEEERNNLNRMSIVVRYFYGDYTEESFNVNLDWKLIEDEGKILYYQNHNDYLAIWEKQNGIYSAIWSDLNELKMLIQKME